MLAVFALFNPALGMCTVVPEMNPSRLENKSQKIVDSILKNQVTNSLVHLFWSIILKYCQSKNHASIIKRVIMAGAPAPQSLLEQLKEYMPNGEIFTPYGATEALPVSSCRQQRFSKSRSVNQLTA